MTARPDPDEQRVALVTGGARGIGGACAAALAASGLRVLVLDAAGLDLDAPGADLAGHGLAGPDDVDALARRARDEGWAERLRVHRGDVRRLPDVEGACAAAVAQWGRLDVVVAAAAVVAGGQPLWEVPPADLDQLWRTDVLGVWHAAAAAVPRMLAGPDPSGCRFVAIASAAGGRGLFHLAAYTTVKHAVVGLVRGLAADLVGTGVTAVAVSPGATGTAMLDRTADLYGVPAGELARAQLLREVLDPEEVAAAVAFCCSRAGRVLDGSVVAADGGFAG